MKGKNIKERKTMIEAIFWIATIVFLGGSAWIKLGRLHVTTHPTLSGVVLGVCFVAAITMALTFCFVFGDVIDWNH
jgi:hypothetical protein